MKKGKRGSPPRSAKLSDNDQEAARVVGERIRKIRKEKLRMNQGQLAQELDVSHGTISHWERGGNATPANLRRFAQFAGVSLEWLMQFGPENPGHQEYPRWQELSKRIHFMPKDSVDALIDRLEMELNWRDEEIEKIQKMQQKRTKDGRVN